MQIPQDYHKQQPREKKMGERDEISERSKAALFTTSREWELHISMDPEVVLAIFVVMVIFALLAAFRGPICMRHK
ncbi:unnamed protein product [Clonostachys rosea]|uniref:Uncharacterized protein n=1 Tax=Bionectria ochroleuca TaxID=29856 RepID=A0ABY6V4Y1_BIOOC|nr:unnamed protein product [Clonostachys rosea]